MSAPRPLVWALHDRRRAIRTAAAAGAVVWLCTVAVLVSMVSTMSGNDTTTAGAGATPTATAGAEPTPTASWQPTVDSAAPEPTHTTDPVAPDQADLAARAFTGAWLAGRTAKSEAEWMKALLPHIDPTAEANFTGTNLAAIPNATVTSTTTTLTGPYTATTTVALSDGSWLEVGTAYTGTDWWAITVEPTSPAAA